MPFIPSIADYGLIADGHTAALIARDGSLGWLCLPRFDSPSVFASLLDPERGGHWTLRPRALDAGRQHYAARTNVLITEFRRPGLHLRLTDWMPPRFAPEPRPVALDQGAVFRRLEMLEGEIDIEIICDAAPGYGQHHSEWRAIKTKPNLHLWHAANDIGLWLQSPVALKAEARGLGARFHLRAGESRAFALAWGGEPNPLREADLLESLAATLRFWRNWAAQGKYEGPYQEQVLRSALALKALIYEPTGALVAAPTTSLPERIGGPRNWDYRYCWPRDGTFALYGLSLLGYHDDAGRFLRFISDLARRHPLPLQVCYRVDGDSQLPEQELPWLSGYRNSRPVRIGNGAAAQSQLDIYGEILDAAYTYAKWRNGLELDLWQVLSQLVDYAAAHWREKDESIWEVRGGPRQFVYSKLMCWVALDRGIKLSRKYRLPAPRQRWLAAAMELRQAIWRDGYRNRIHAFAQTFDNDVLDASLLLLPLVRFLKPRDPRMQSTLRAIRSKLANGPLVWRYENTHEDGVGGGEATFSICSFWLIDCLTLSGQTREARKLFEQILARGSRLGLFSEELEPQPSESGEADGLLGNYPQAFTHMALINSAHNLSLYPAGVPEAGEKGKPAPRKRRGENGTQ